MKVSEDGNNERDDDYYKLGHVSGNSINDNDSEHSSTEARDQVCHDKFQEFEEIKRKGPLDKNQLKQSLLIGDECPLPKQGEICETLG